jgi:hypothetical protein
MGDKPFVRRTTGVTECLIQDKSICYYLPISFYVKNYFLYKGLQKQKAASIKTCGSEHFWREHY